MPENMPLIQYIISENIISTEYHSVFKFYPLSYPVKNIKKFFE